MFVLKAIFYVNLKMENEWKFKCRICFSIITNENYTSIFHQLNENDPTSTLAHVLKLYTSIELLRSDNGDMYACEKCTSILIDFHNVINVFKSSEVYLNSNVEFCVNDNESFASDTFDVDYKSDECKDDVKYDKFENVNNEDLFTECNGVKYSCDSCGDCFLLKSGFQRHMMVMHQKLLQDEDFGYYSSEIKLKIPMFFPKTKRFTEPKPVQLQTEFACKICRKTFETNKDFTEHLNQHKSFICEICGGSFMKKSYLLDHKAIHKNEKRFKCTICNKAFSHRSSLRVHKLTHNPSKQFVCDFCGHGFNQSKNLSVHIKAKHLKEKNYPCPECGLSFTVKSWLDKHYVRKHTVRNKEFSCSICGMKYMEKGTLRRHMMDKHFKNLQKRQACTLCDKKFADKSSVKRHLQKKHNIVDVCKVNDEVVNKI